MFRVLPIRVLTDNYSYLIMDLTTKQVAVVDPVDPLMIKKVLDHEQASVSMILTTHHHWDHASGNNKMKELYPHVSVYGNDQRIQGLTHPATTPFQLGSLSITPIQTPCHTL
jgi:hydroxyacylglutathione hydrolase